MTTVDVVEKSMVYPFSAITGQENLKKALLLCAVDPKIGGVLLRGEKGTAKSTAVRSLASLLPSIEVSAGCAFSCHPGHVNGVCPDCVARGTSRKVIRRRVRVVNLPLNTTQDRLLGGIDFTDALQSGQYRLLPGLLAEANRGFLYVDEVNLLDDFLADALLDAAESGRCVVEREGISYVHPARFVLVGTMNPEEGELRPQLLDRFGLCIQVKGISEPELRVQVMERRISFDENPHAFVEQWTEQSANTALKVADARKMRSEVAVEKNLMLDIVKQCIRMQVDGHRADIITLKAAKALAAWRGRKDMRKEDIDSAAEMALPHRLRRQPFDEIGPVGNTVSR